jgi:hypothetical protein
MRAAPFQGVAAMRGQRPAVSAVAGQAPQQQLAPMSLPPRPPTIEAALSLVNDVFFDKLRTVEPQLRLLEARCDASEAEIFVNDVFAAYAENRGRIVAPVLSEYSGVDKTRPAAPARASPSPNTPSATSAFGRAMNAHSASNTNPSGGGEIAFIELLLDNLACCLTEERVLFDRVWLSDDVPTTGFESIANTVADAAYQHFRAALLRTDELEDLTAMCRSLIAFSTSAANAANAAAAATGVASSIAFVGPVVKRMVQDAQERAVFRTSIYIRHKVAPFPYSGEMLWRQCLTAVHLHASGSSAPLPAAAAEQPPPSSSSQPGSTTTASVPTLLVPPATSPAPSAASPLISDGQGGGAATESLRLGSTESLPSLPPATPLSPMTATEPSVFVPLERCVQLLNMLYPAVTQGVFAVFADECVHAAVTNLLRAAKLIKQHGDLATAGSARGATGPAAAVAASLSTLYSRLFLVRHLLRLREALTPFDVNFTIVEKGLNLSSLAERKLELFQRSRESKRDVETELRGACEGAIEVMSAVVAKPLRDAAGPAFTFGPTSGASDVSDYVDKAVQDCSTIAGAIHQDLAAFIESSPTRNILWRPVQGAAREAYKGLEEKVKTVHSDFAASADIAAVLENLG